MSSYETNFIAYRLRKQHFSLLNTKYDVFIVYSVSEEPNLFSWFQGVHRGGNEIIRSSGILRNVDRYWSAWRSKTGSIGCPETSVTN
jgi:hypothetical protein